jgi:hypothetical protein
VRHFLRGDVILYFTIKGTYEDMPPHRRLTAVLRVVAERTSHAAAGDWYRAQGKALPRNLMLPGNGPLPLGMTEGFYRRKRKDRGKPIEEIVRPRGPEDYERIVAEWDKLYSERKARCQDVRICEALFRDVWHGKNVDDALVGRAFGRAFPNTKDKPQRIETLTAERLLGNLGLEDVFRAATGGGAAPAEHAPNGGPRAG